MRLRVQSLPLLSGLTIWRCCELWCRLQTWLGSYVAVALVQAGGYSSNRTPSLGTSTCRGRIPRKDEKTKKKNKTPQKNPKNHTQNRTLDPSLPECLCPRVPAAERKLEFTQGPLSSPLRSTLTFILSTSHFFLALSTSAAFSLVQAPTSPPWTAAEI